MQKSVETIQLRKEAHVALMDNPKKTWICLECNNSYLHHSEIVEHMHSENHTVIVSSDFVPVNEISQVEIRKPVS